MTHQERGRPLLIPQWAPVKKTGEINPCRCFHRPSKSTLGKGIQPRQWTARPSQHWRGMAHLIPKEMLGVSCSGGPQRPHPPFLAAGSPSHCPMAFSTSSLPTQPTKAPGQPQQGGGNFPGLPTSALGSFPVPKPLPASPLLPGMLPAAPACLLPPLPVCGV